MKKSKKKIKRFRIELKDFIVPIIIILLLIAISIHYIVTKRDEIKGESITLNNLVNKIKNILKEVRIFKAPGNPPQFNLASLPNLTELCEDRTYFFDINATDLDNDTLVYTTDSSLFSIDRNTGIIDFTPSNLQVGNYTNESTASAIVVKDPSQLGALYIWGFNISATNDAPVLNSFILPKGSKFVNYHFEISSTDEENDQLTYFDNTVLFNITTNVTRGIIDFTPTQAQVGIHLINISVCDNSSTQNTLNCIFPLVRCDSVIAVLNISDNNPPTITKLPNLTSIQDRPYVPYFDFINGTDIDGDPITFYSNSPIFLVNITTGQIYQINISGGSVINFTPKNNETGNYSIMFWIQDSKGAINSTTVIFEVIDINEPPNITSFYPNNLSLEIYENTTTEFNFTAIDPDITDTILFNRWIINYTINTSLPFVSKSFNITTSFNDSNRTFNKILNLILLVFDDSLPLKPGVFLGDGSLNPNFTQWNDSSSYVSWNITILNLNRPPILYRIIPNQSWAQGSLNTNIDLDDYFLDPDSEVLTFSYVFLTNTTAINVSIDPNSHIVSLLPGINYTGSELIRFIANDLENITLSNIVNLTVFPSNVTVLVPVPVPQPVPSSGGSSGGSSTRIASLDIILQSLIPINQNTTIKVPIKLKNTGEVDLSGIKLSTFEETRQLSLLLSNNSFTSLSVGQFVDTELTIKATYLTEKNYKVLIYANVSDPILSESNTIYLTSIPANITKLEVEIEFAVDLFEKNSGCLELKELIDQAKQKQIQKKEDEASNLIQSAIQSCTNILKESKTRIPQVIVKPKIYFYIPLVLGLLALFFVITIILFILYKRKK